MKYLVLLATIAFGVARFFVPVEGKIDNADFFKDGAHIFVGGLFGAAIYATSKSGPPLLQAFKSQWQLWTLAIGLTVLEVVAFLVRRA